MFVVLKCFICYKKLVVLAAACFTGFLVHGIQPDYDLSVVISLLCCDDYGLTALSKVIERILTRQVRFY